MKACPELALTRDQGQHESIMSFAADGLQSGRLEARFRRQHFEEAAHSLHRWVRTVLSDHIASTDNIVCNQDGPGAGKTKRPFQVRRVVRFIGVEEDQIE